MSKIKKSELLDIIREQGSAITNLLQRVTLLEKPQLKKLDQSVFKGWADYWKFFAIDEDGQGWFYRNRPSVIEDDKRWMEPNRTPTRSGFDYDASNWRDSLIERNDIAKKLLEVDLNSEPTGSELCKAMLERGDKYVMCIVSPYRDAIDNDSIILPKIVTMFHEYGFITTSGKWAHAVPINNQGEPLTARDVGL